MDAPGVAGDGQRRCRGWAGVAVLWPIEKPVGPFQSSAVGVGGEIMNKDGARTQAPDPVGEEA